MARLAAEGHRVVLVVATAGERGLAALDGRPLGEVRMAELHASARVLGCARVVLLGYAASGPACAPDGFASVPVAEAAAELAAVLRQENADLLTVYDPAGGDGAPHHVEGPPGGGRAAAPPGDPVGLGAAVGRGPLLRRARPGATVHRGPSGLC